MRFLKSQNGLTLIEILIVVVILGVLASVIVANVADSPTKRENARDGSQGRYRHAGAGAKMYRLDNTAYPTTRAGLARTGAKARPRRCRPTGKPVAIWSATQ